jgi:hypothetical protein
MLKELLILTLSLEMAQQLKTLSAIVTFFQLYESKPNATHEEMDVEQTRLYKEMTNKMDEIPKTPGSNRAAFKAALLYLAGQL